MSNVSFKVPWNPWLGAACAILIFLAAQLMAGILLSIYPWLRHWSYDQAMSWLNHSLGAQLSFISLNAVLVITGLKLFFKATKTDFGSIGLTRPRAFDLAYSLAGFFFYFLTLALTIAVIANWVPRINLEQKQELGFTAGTYSGFELGLIFVMLVIITPLIEEIVFRGLLYGSLKKRP